MKSRLTNLILFILVALVPADAVRGQFHEEFESGRTSWQRHETDCSITQASWVQKRFRDPDANNGCERVHFTNGPGTKVYLSHKVSPAFVISELNPSVRIKATRPGVQLMARVVLPHSPSPSGDGPLTTMLAGPRYEGRGRWETLSFEKKSFDLQRQLTERVWLLRRKYGSSVDQRDAYVDKFQEHNGSMIMLAKGNRSKQVTDACKKHGGFYLGTIGGTAAKVALDCIKKIEVLEFSELGMEAVWKIEVEDFPAFIVIDNKGNDFFKN